MVEHSLTILASEEKVTNTSITDCVDGTDDDAA